MRRYFCDICGGEITKYGAQGLMHEIHSTVLGNVPAIFRIAIQLPSTPERAEHVCRECLFKLVTLEIAKENEE